jgi:DMSO reductase anchor subunit
VLILIIATVYATSMIYASLKTVARWYHPLTPICYLMFAAAGGLLAACWLLAMIGQHVTAVIQQSALLLLAAAWGVKLIWWRVAGAAGSGSSLASATGLSALGEVRSIMPPHTSENYLQHEMGFIVARRHAEKLRLLSLGFGAVLPLFLIWLAPLSAPLLGIALVSHIAGVFVERWLFFAEAKHVVSLYYGEVH